MPEYKNQHYVPKHLLRGWTDNERLSVYNLDNQQEYPPTSLSNLCSEDYFYGDSEIEQSMDDLEKRHAEIIDKIRTKKSFGVINGVNILHFCTFILLQRERTKQQKQETEGLINNLAKEYIEREIKAGNTDPELSDGRDILDVLDKTKITHEYPLAFPMFHALIGVNLILDLEVAVIVNTTDEEFVISDHPVVHDNPRFKDRFDRFLSGIQSRGIQIFVPISDQVQIMIYDPAAYTIDYSDLDKRRVVVTSKEVVTGLNDMQMINAFENIFYSTSNQEEKFIDAQQRISEYIKEKNTLFRTLDPEEHDFDSENEIIEHGYRLVEYSPTLPFVKQQKYIRFASARDPKAVQKYKKLSRTLLEDVRQEQDATVDE